MAPKAAELDKSLGFPWEGLKKLAEAGMMGMVVPPAFGGGGADTLSFVLAVEAIAKACPSTALVFVTHAVGTLGILTIGDAQRESRQNVNTYLKKQGLVVIIPRQNLVNGLGIGHRKEVWPGEGA